MMLDPKKAILVVIDVQGKLAYLMHDRDNLFKHIQALIQVAKILNIPIIYTEQAPHKIGVTVPEIKNYLMDHEPILKDSFSCALEPKFMSALRKFYRNQVIVIGIETHVCIYQTVSDLISKSYPIHLVADAVSSRTKENKDIAVEGMRSIGATITSTEMVATQLLKTSAHPKFKEVLSLIR